jgi:predicted branched-subunit amino acid permease
MSRSRSFFSGLGQGIPIGLGYLSVSFGFGIMAVRAGLSVTEASLISLTNLTSAGQAAGVDVIASHGSLLEMALVQLTINIRYALMSLALSQKTDSAFSFPHRLLASFGITDEIFAVASIQKEPLKPAFMYGITLIAFLGWTFGTWLGAAAGTLLPEKLTNALGIALYGMFLAIILPPARKSKGILAVVIFAAACSVLLKVTVKWMSGGFALIIASLAAAVFGAAVFPVDPEKTEVQE